MKVVEIKQEISGFKDVVKLFNDVADAMKGSCAKEVYDNLIEKGYDVALDEVMAIVEEFEDPEYGPSVTNTDGLFYHMAKKAGYMTFKLGRATAVVLPGKLIKKIEIPVENGKKHDVMEDEALFIIVFSDPDSAIVDYSVVAITGYRFGLDDVLINGDTYYTVHGNHDGEIRTHIHALKIALGIRSYSNAGESGEEYQSRLEKIEQFKQSLDDLLEFLLS